MRVQTVNLSLPRKLLEAADKVASEEMRTRSELIREALRSYILRRGEWEAVFRAGRKKSKQLNIKPADIENIIHEYRVGE